MLDLRSVDEHVEAGKVWLQHGGQVFGSSLRLPGTTEHSRTRKLSMTVNLDRLFQTTGGSGHIPMLPNGVHFPIIWASLSLDTLRKVDLAHVDASRHQHSYVKFGKDSDCA